METERGENGGKRRMREKKRRRERWGEEDVVHLCLYMNFVFRFLFNDMHYLDEHVRIKSVLFSTFSHRVGA